MNVCIGGTFDHLHNGHKALITKAFEIAGKEGSVFIGIIKGELAQKKGNIEPYIKRKQAVKRFLSDKKLSENVIIKPIYEKYGPSINGDFDAIIISPDTYSTAEEINIKRRDRNMKPLAIIEIPFVLAEDQQPISSSRIRKKIINNRGEVLK